MHLSDHALNRREREKEKKRGQYALNEAVSLQPASKASLCHYSQPARRACALQPASKASPCHYSQPASKASLCHYSQPARRACALQPASKASLCHYSQPARRAHVKIFFTYRVGDLVLGGVLYFQNSLDVGEFIVNASQVYKVGSLQLCTRSTKNNNK